MKLPFVTRYTDNAKGIQHILKKKWKILENDPHLKEDTGRNPVMLYRKSRTLKDILAPSYPSLATKLEQIMTLKRIKEYINVGVGNVNTVLP